MNVLCKQRVTGSSPLSSTRVLAGQRRQQPLVGSQHAQHQLVGSQHSAQQSTQHLRRLLASDHSANLSRLLAHLPLPFVFRSVPFPVAAAKMYRTDRLSSLTRRVSARRAPADTVPPVNLVPARASRMPGSASSQIRRA
jgi:hypothetical protein